MKVAVIGLGSMGGGAAASALRAGLDVTGVDPSEKARNAFGNRAVANVPKLQKLMRHVCREGFEHHVVMNSSHTAGILAEAFARRALEGSEAFHGREQPGTLASASNQWVSPW